MCKAVVCNVIWPGVGVVGPIAALGEAGQDGSIVGCRQGSYPCSREGWTRDAWQTELVVNSRGRDYLSRGHGGHALEGFVLHGLVLLTAVTKGLALTQKGEEGHVAEVAATRL